MLSLTNIPGRWGRQNGDHDFDGGGGRSIITLLVGLYNFTATALQKVGIEINGRFPWCGENLNFKILVFKDYFFKVGVEINGHFPWCGGTLVSAREVLTAAHCTYDRKKSRIKVIELIHSYKVI